MITNMTEPAVAERLARCREEIPPAGPVLDALANCPDPMEFRVDGTGWEFAGAKPVEGRPNRAVLKLFIVPDGNQKGQAAAFFYKRSQVPFSRDRFSYGVCMMPGQAPPPEETAEWIEFVSSGLHPDAQPKKLRRAFTFNIPE